MNIKFKNLNSINTRFLFNQIDYVILFNTEDTLLNFRTHNYLKSKLFRL